MTGGKEDGDREGGSIRNEYLVPVPRGLQQVVIEMLQDHVRGYQLTVKTTGEILDELSLKDVLDDTTKLPGSSFHEGVKKHLSIGYHRDQKVWCIPGVWEGSVWLRITTNAPVSLMTDIKCLGPMLASVKVWENLNLSNDIEETLKLVRKFMDQEYDANFEQAVNLWKSHVLRSWPLSDDQRQAINTGSVKFRASCTRSQSKKLYSYSREDFLKGIVDDVIPKTFKWTVDLSIYHVEVVLLVLSPTTLAIGLTLRPYQLLGANNFHKNSLPPDISPPYMTGGALSGVLRLRPTTANILLQLASLEPGDIVLDPCVGIGTIPIQISKQAVGLGGDLVLIPAALAGVAHSYIKQLGANFQKSANLVGWDASWLPLRSSSIDVVVSDLPFGQTCLSSAKLDSLLPLVLGEMARVLRPVTGRVVLLCGTYTGINCALEALNHISPNNWILPCESAFPVNIGGIIAWVVIARRGSGDGTRIQQHQQRVQKMTAKREITSRQRNADQGRQGNHQKRFRLQA